MPIRVLMLASSYPRNPTDWRSRFILDMLESIVAGSAAHGSVSYWGPAGPLPDGAALTARADEQAWLDTLMDSGGLAHLLRNRPVAGLASAAGFLWRLRRACQRERSNHDVLHVNWLQNVLGLPRDAAPMLVTVLGSDFGLLRKPGVPRLVRAALGRRRCILAPNAGWMKPRLDTLFGDLSEVVPIPFGVGAPWYRIHRSERSGPRRWLVVARVTHAKIGPLFEWGRSVFGAQDELHLLGPMQDAIDLPEWVHYHGPTHPEALRERWFPEATGLVTLSSHDEGRPQVLLEAMASGLPVVASGAPAHRDVIEHGATGFLVDTQTEFRSAIATLADPAVAAQVGGAARRWAVDHIGTWQDTGRRYHDLYRRLLDDPK